jgi:hypothetical protein
MRSRRQQLRRGSGSASYAINSRMLTHITYTLQVEAPTNQSPTCRSSTVSLGVVFQSDHRFSMSFATIPSPAKPNAINCLIQSLQPPVFKTKLIQWIVHDSVAFDQAESRYFREMMLEANGSLEQAGCLPTCNTIQEWIMKCHDITLLRGCLIAGLPLILTERAEHYYKSMGWSPFHKITIINIINLPLCSCALPVNLDRL